MIYISPKFSFNSSLTPLKVKKKIEGVIEDYANHSIIEQQFDGFVNFRFNGYVNIKGFELFRWSPKPILEYRDKLFNQLSILEGTIKEVENGTIVSYQVKANDIYKKLFFAFVFISLLIFGFGFNQESNEIKFGAILLPLLYLCLVNVKIRLFHREAKYIFKKLFDLE